MSSSGGSDSAGNSREAASTGQYGFGNTARESYGGGEQYQTSSPPPSPPARDPDGTREQRITNQYTSPEGINVASRDPSLGDPDPEVDVPTDKRQDTITSFAKNLKANIAANPLMASPLGLTTTAIQTGIANAMLGNIPSGSFGGDESVGGDGGNRDLVNLLTPYAPYAMRGEIAPQSMVNQYFQNLGLGQEPLSSSLQTDYNNAKTNINSLLGILPPSQQFGYSTAPYGSLSSTNLASNPFNIDYLQQRGLI